MSAGDWFECAIDALLRVMWWGFWFGIVANFLGNGWGFLLVLSIVFISNIFKRERKLKALEKQVQGEDGAHF